MIFRRYSGKPLFFRASLILGHRSELNAFVTSKLTRTTDSRLVLASSIISLTIKSASHVEAFLLNPNWFSASLDVGLFSIQSLIRPSIIRSIILSNSFKRQIGFTFGEAGSNFSFDIRISIAFFHNFQIYLS